MQFTINVETTVEDIKTLSTDVNLIDIQYYKKDCIKAIPTHVIYVMIKCDRTNEALNDLRTKSHIKFYDFYHIDYHHDNHLIPDNITKIGINCYVNTSFIETLSPNVKTLFLDCKQVALFAAIPTFIDVLQVCENITYQCIRSAPNHITSIVIFKMNDYSVLRGVKKTVLSAAMSVTADVSLCQYLPSHLLAFNFKNNHTSHDVLPLLPATIFSYHFTHLHLSTYKETYSLLQEHVTHLSLHMPLSVEQMTEIPDSVQSLTLTGQLTIDLAKAIPNHIETVHLINEQADDIVKAITTKHRYISPAIPFNSVLHYLKAKSYFTLGDYQQAITTLNKSIRLCSRFTFAYELRLAARLKSNDHTMIHADELMLFKLRNPTVVPKLMDLTKFFILKNEVAIATASQTVPVTEIVTLRSLFSDLHISNAAFNHNQRNNIRKKRKLNLFRAFDNQENQAASHSAAVPTLKRIKK